jgi:hypothetical protein
MRMRFALPIVLLFASSVVAQERESPRFRIGLGLSGGEFDFSSDDSPLRGETDAGLFRLQFEGTSRRGIGGGVRFEGIASDDDLFADEGFTASEATSSTLFGHFTWRLEEHRFAMPLRLGLLLNGLELTEQGSGAETTYGSFGPYFEIAPEITLARSGKTNWSIYGEFGFGAAGTVVDLSGDNRDYDSTSGFAGVELGTRLALGKVELGLAYVGRWQSADESDPEGGFVAPGYDVDYQGLLFTFGVVF